MGISAVGITRSADNAHYQLARYGAGTSRVLLGVRFRHELLWFGVALLLIPIAPGSDRVFLYIASGGVLVSILIRHGGGHILARRLGTIIAWFSLALLLGLLANMWPLLKHIRDLTIGVRGRGVSFIVSGVLVVVGQITLGFVGIQYLREHRYAASPPRLAALAVLAPTFGCVIVRICMDVLDYGRFTLLVPLLPMIAYSICSLLIRTWLVTSTSPEALGYLLFYMRDTHVSSRRVLGRYSLNYLLCASPLLGVIFYLISGTSVPVAAGVLFGALVVLDMSINTLVIMRTAKILPARQIPRLAQLSMSGLSSMVVFAILFGAIGATVMGSSVPSLWNSITPIVGLCFALSIVIVVVIIGDAGSWFHSLVMTNQVCEAPADD
jgi:hypothetical protein